MGSAQRGLGLVIVFVFVAQNGLGAFLGSHRSSAIDLITELGDVAENADLVVADLHETTMNGDVELAAVGQCDPSVVLCECTEKWGMTRKESDLAAAKGTRNHLSGFTRKDNLLG